MAKDKPLKENSTEDIVERYRADVKSLLPYLSWLESHAGKDSGISENYGGERLSGSISFPVYDSTLLSLVKQAQNTKLLDRNYVYVYSRNHLKTAEDELKEQTDTLTDVFRKALNNEGFNIFIIPLIGIFNLSHSDNLSQCPASLLFLTYSSKIISVSYFITSYINRFQV